MGLFFICLFLAEVVLWTVEVQHANFILQFYRWFSREPFSFRFIRNILKTLWKLLYILYAIFQVIGLYILLIPWYTWLSILILILIHHFCILLKWCYLFNWGTRENISRSQFFLLIVCIFLLLTSAFEYLSQKSLYGYLP